MTKCSSVRYPNTPWHQTTPYTRLWKRGKRKNGVKVHPTMELEVEEEWERRKKREKKIEQLYITRLSSNEMSKYPLVQEYVLLPTIERGKGDNGEKRVGRRKTEKIVYSCITRWSSVRCPSTHWHQTTSYTRLVNLKFCKNQILAEWNWNLMAKKVIRERNDHTQREKEKDTGPLKWCLGF